MHAHETNCSSWGMPIDVCIKDLILLQHVYEPKILYNYNMSLQIMKGPNKQIEPEKKTYLLDKKFNFGFSYVKLGSSL